MDQHASPAPGPNPVRPPQDNDRRELATWEDDLRRRERELWKLEMETNLAKDRAQAVLEREGAVSAREAKVSERERELEESRRAIRRDEHTLELGNRTLADNTARAEAQLADQRTRFDAHVQAETDKIADMKARAEEHLADLKARFDAHAQAENAKIADKQARAAKMVELATHQAVKVLEQPPLSDLSLFTSSFLTLIKEHKK